MKAVRVHAVGGPEVLQIEEVPIFEPVESQVVVRVEAVGINPVETYIRSAKTGRAPPSIPYTPGHDGAGTVHSIGPNVTKWKVGDRVFTTNSISGTYAQYTLCDESGLQSLPENTSFDAGYVHKE
jgi:NADPH2:quinone reductase